MKKYSSFINIKRRFSFLHITIFISNLSKVILVIYLSNTHFKTQNDFFNLQHSFSQFILIYLIFYSAKHLKYNISVKKSNFFVLFIVMILNF